jgi:hypothetical protein
VGRRTCRVRNAERAEPDASAVETALQASNDKLHTPLPATQGSAAFVGSAIPSRTTTTRMAPASSPTPTPKYQ